MRKSLKVVLCSILIMLLWGTATSAEEKPSPTTTTTIIISSNPPSFFLTQPTVPPTALQGEWWELARQVGWAEKDLPTLDFVIHRESRGDNTAWNKQDPWGGSRCILQINGSWTKWLRTQGVLQRASDLFDPTVCLTAGLTIHRYGMDRYGWGWNPWAIPAP